ncbi:MAG: response regulator transcription factor [Lachnospiraceae bacterium]
MDYQNTKLLLVDDEQGILDMLVITLKREHFNNITCATSASQALEYIDSQSFDLILLDVMMQDFSGFELCQEIRKTYNTPIIFVTAMASDLDKLTGLTIGGDDYITKPFNPLEVAARIKVVLRRLGSQLHGEQSARAKYSFGDYTLDMMDFTLRQNDEVIECTAKELDLLRFFCENPRRVFTTGQIYEAVWGNQAFGDEKTVGMYISKLRKKIGDDAKAPTIIVNQRGIGYKFVPPGELKL